MHTSFKYFSFLLVFFVHYSGISQTDSSTCIVIDFNDHEFKELNNRIKVKPVGVTLTKDRFGNRNSAAYVYGNASSYIHLGTSELLKPKHGTFSMWVNLKGAMKAGKGYPANVFLSLRNGPGEDFIHALNLGYNFESKRIGTQSTKDSLKEVIIFSDEETEFHKWYHIVVTYNDDFFALYINGELQARLNKGFETQFWPGDSLILGRTTSTKNERFAHAVFDDIRIYHRTLNEAEILDLYNEPNPNRVTNILIILGQYLSALGLVLVVVVIMMIRNKRKLRKQKERFELESKIRELEIKVIKSQMNPHFISNCLAAIQNLIYQGDVENASKYLAKFNVFLRKVLDYTDRPFTKLTEEIAIVKLMIELEQLRFKNGFDFTVNTNEKICLDEVQVPSLITQPFIENAIWHGLLPLKDKRPQLTLSVYLENEIVFMAIEDNGVGRQNGKISSGKSSMGTKLAQDKIDSINKLRNNKDLKLDVIDLFDGNKNPAGTKIIIQLSKYTKEE